MRKSFGSSSEDKKCVFCKKNTSNFIEYTENGVDIRVWLHEDSCQEKWNNSGTIQYLLKTIYSLMKRG